MGHFFRTARDRNVHLSHKGAAGPRPWAPARMTEKPIVTFSGRGEKAEGALEFHTNQSPRNSAETRAVTLCRRYVAELEQAPQEAKKQKLA
jgi:hypothetical protein